VEARREKARRGELIQAAPVGYIKTEDQRVEKDPDLRFQQVILLIFRKFVELGSSCVIGSVTETHQPLRI
jgi:hypothetical protein